MKTLLVLGTRSNQIPIIQYAKQRGLRVVAIDPAPSPKATELADRVFTHDLANVDACMAIARRENIDGVLTAGADYPVPTAAIICATLGLSGLSERAATLATNKKEMKRAFAEHDVPSPLSIAVKNMEGMMVARAQIAGDVIVKPGQSSGGRGITWLAADASNIDFEIALERAMKFTLSGEALIESCVEGAEYSIEMLIYDGECHIIAVTNKVTSGKPHFVELGHTQPTHLSAENKRILEGVAMRGVDALEIDSSAVHAELCWGPNGPSIIEIGARLGGGFIATHLVPLSTGINMVAAAISLALGEMPQLIVGHDRGAAIKFFTPPQGTVTRIEGVDAACKVLGVQEVELYVEVGEMVRPLQDDTCRVGHVIAESVDATAAADIVAYAAGLIEVQTS